MQRADSFEKTLMLGKIEGRRRRGQQRMRRWYGITSQWTCIWVNSGSWCWTGKPGVLQFMGLQRVGHWTELNFKNCKKLKITISFRIQIILLWGKHCYPEGTFLSPSMLGLWYVTFLCMKHPKRLCLVKITNWHGRKSIGTWHLWPESFICHKLLIWLCDLG